MKKVLLLLTLCFILSNLGGVSTTEANSLSNLSVAESTENWSLMIKKINTSDNAANKQDYRMNVNFKGNNEDIKNVRIETFRDEEKKDSMLRLWTVEEKNSPNEPIIFENFPVSVQAEKLEVYITWTNKADNKTYQDKFTAISM